MSRYRHIHLHLVADVQQECAWILQPPRYIRNYESRVGRDGATADLHRNGEGHRVIAAMQPENAFQLNRRSALQRDRSRNFAERERDFRIFVAFQYLVMHLPIARCVPGICAGRIRRNNAACRSAPWIKANSAAFHLKRAMHSVQGCAQGEMNTTPGRIKFQRHLLRVDARRAYSKDDAAGYSQAREQASWAASHLLSRAQRVIYCYL